MSESGQSESSLTIQSALALYKDIDSDSPLLDIELIVCHVLGCDRSYLRIWPDKAFDSQQAESFREIFSRRQAGEPIAYLLGYRAFWDLELKVSEHTLIPRPDTEVLVEQALNLSLPQHAKVLDLGTGTGAIALALASERKHWQVCGLDRFDEVIELAQQNAQYNQLESVEFYVSNWFENVSDTQFDLIVSNPPYIEEHDPHLAQGDVRFEPRSALTSGADGLDDIRLITKQASAFLNSNGVLMFEHGYDQGHAVRKILDSAGFDKTETIKDYGGNDRVSFGYLVLQE